MSISALQTQVNSLIDSSNLSKEIKDLTETAVFDGFLHVQKSGLSFKIPLSKFTDSSKLTTKEKKISSNDTDSDFASNSAIIDYFTTEFAKLKIGILELKDELKKLDTPLGATIGAVSVDMSSSIGVSPTTLTGATTITFDSTKLVDGKMFRFKLKGGGVQWGNDISASKVAYDPLKWNIIYFTYQGVVNTKHSWHITNILV